MSRPVISSFRRWVLPSEDPQQWLRVERFGMAFLAYLVCFAIALVCSILGFIDWYATAIGIGAALAINGWVYWMFRSGRNTRFEDPSLTLVQTVLATAFLMYGVYVAGDVRILFVMLYPIPFMFGAFRLSVLEHAMVAAFALAAYALVIGLLWQWQPERVHLRQEILQWVTLAIELAWMVALGRALNTMRRRSTHDQLTGILNRHAVLDALEREEQRCHRGGPPFSVCLIDIDHLKQFNDRYGHAAGDAALKRFAQTVARELRSVDCFGRYGGDEFLMVLMNTELEHAWTLVDRIRATVEMISLQDLAPGVRLSISVGIAEFGAGESVAHTVARADLALYQAKRTGRNRVARAPATPLAGAPGTPGVVIPLR